MSRELEHTSSTEVSRRPPFYIATFVQDGFPLIKKVEPDSNEDLFLHFKELAARFHGKYDAFYNGLGKEFPTHFDKKQLKAIQYALKYGTAKEQIINSSTYLFDLVDGEVLSLDKIPEPQISSTRNQRMKLGNAKVGPYTAFFLDNLIAEQSAHEKAEEMFNSIKYNSRISAYTMHRGQSIDAILKEVEINSARKTAKRKISEPKNTNQHSPRKKWALTIDAERQIPVKQEGISPKSANSPKSSKSEHKSDYQFLAPSASWSPALGSLSPSFFQTHAFSLSPTPSFRSLFDLTSPISPSEEKEANSPGRVRSPGTGNSGIGRFKL